MGASETLQKQKVPQAEGPATPVETAPLYFEGGWRDTEVYRWQDLLAGHELEGPALIIQDGGTIVIEPNCRARVTEYGDVAIEVDAPEAGKLDTEVDLIQLGIFNNLFMSIAEQMGRTLAQRIRPGPRPNMRRGAIKAAEPQTRTETKQDT